MTFWVTGQCSNSRATPTRAKFPINSGGWEEGQAGGFPSQSLSFLTCEVGKADPPANSKGMHAATLAGARVSPLYRFGEARRRSQDGVPGVRAEPDWLKH